MTVMQPFKTEVDLQSGVFSPRRDVIQRYLSQMRTMFADTEAVERILREEGDRLIYEVHVTELPEEEGHILHCTTIIYPGMVGNEYHMTKGHYHARREQGEVYLGLSGQGYLVMQTEAEDTNTQAMQAGTAAYVPPYWAHRTVNTGSTPFVFFAAWAGEAGHDYGTIEQVGFRKLVIQQGGETQVVDNQKYS
ncbi:MAG: cupin domain-containing protein [Anaerolineae bacterium]|nr:cupin domain-containing protein [Anaerolineae bacterium]